MAEHEQRKTERVLSLARKAGVLRPRDLASHRIQRVYLQRLHRRGLLVRTGRGLYTLPEADLTENHDLAEVSKRLPQGIICLVSALRFHGLTTQVPHEVWLALDPKARAPRRSHPPIRVVRMSAQTRTAGIEEHRIEGVVVRVFGPAKTVVDCFKYRNKIGLDVALEALRDAWRQRRARMDDLWRYAEICRIRNVIRPYLESLV